MIKVEDNSNLDRVETVVFPEKSQEESSFVNVKEAQGITMENIESPR